MEKQLIEKITLSLKDYLKEYKTAPEIIGWLKLCGVEISLREFATYTEEYRKENHEYYLESCSNGYRFTRDIESIKKSCYQRIGKAVSVIKNAKRDLKNLGERNQLTIIDEAINQLEELQNQVEIAENYKEENNKQQTQLEGVYW